MIVLNVTKFPNIWTYPIVDYYHLDMERYSRLKTRKILGVGESAEGRIPCSKISQLLGPLSYRQDQFPIPVLLWHAMKIAILLALASIRFYDHYWNQLKSTTDTKQILYQPSLMIGYAILHVQSWSSAEKQTMVICYVSTIAANIFAMIECMTIQSRTVFIMLLHFIAIVMDIICLRMLIDNRKRTTPAE
ncbi:hypothetical protein ACOME3_009381 [Neoechinorhynchus agilis]